MALNLRHPSGEPLLAVHSRPKLHLSWIYSLRDLLMSYGCKIINSAGSTMIDENYTNLAVRQKITITLEIGDYTDCYHVYAPLTIAFVLCMVAHRCDAFIGQYICYQQSGSSGRHFTIVGETH